ncbi:membrane protein insertion efficiency factor YidD [Actinocatenispora thailandica]|uniref:membrane protein insertion efficiency factor YidD n=1 Tax=Actinocatenispora thailandica TaxID=227318 RepID=UPI0031DA285F
MTGRAVVPASPHAGADPADAAGAPGPPGGWRRLVPRRPWRWLGGLAALVALGSLAIGVLVVWLTQRPGHGAPAAPGAGPSSGPGPLSGAGSGRPTPGHTPWTPGAGGGPTGDPTGVGGGATGGPTGTGNAGCTVEGVNCDPAGKACDSACSGTGSDCGKQLDDSCAGPSGGCAGSDPGCGSSGGGCSNTAHTLLVSLAGTGLPYLHRTATGPSVPAGAADLPARPAVVPARPRPAGAGPARRVGVPARAGVAAIRAYQRISPRLPTRCRYAPTCSRYGRLAIERYGLLTGARLAVLRIHRCTADVLPGTADPVPA